MDLPYAKRGELFWGKGSLDLNNCTFGELRSLIDMPNQYEAIDSELALFVTDSELGEIQALVDRVGDCLLQLELELFEDLPFEEVLCFLKEEKRISKTNYGYVDDDDDLYVVFSLHFMMRLSPETGRICTFIFYNSNFVLGCEDDFSAKIIEAATKKKKALS